MHPNFPSTVKLVIVLNNIFPFTGLSWYEEYSMVKISMKNYPYFMSAMYPKGLSSSFSSTSFSQEFLYFKG